MPGLPSLPDFPQLVRRRSNSVLPEGLEVKAAFGIATTKECWTSDEPPRSSRAASPRLPSIAKDSPRAWAGPCEDVGSNPLRRSGSLASMAKIRTPRKRSASTEVCAFEEDKAGSSDDEANDALGGATVAAVAASTPREKPPARSRSRSLMARAVSAARSAARASLPSPRPPASPRRSLEKQSSASSVSQDSAEAAVSAGVPERGSASKATPAADSAPPFQRPAGAQTPRGAPRGSIMRQLTPRRLVPTMFQGGKKDSGAGVGDLPETPRSARGKEAAATSRSRAASRPQSARTSGRSSAETPSSKAGASKAAEVVEPAGDPEIESLTHKLLEEVYEQPLEPHQAAIVKNICPEVAWLVQCTLKSPLPPGWRKRSNGSYLNDISGEKSIWPPVLDVFAKLGRLALHARQTPSSASTAAAWVCRARDDALKRAMKAQDEWTGPHLDPDANAEYFHCTATGVSTWSSPFAPDTYLAHVADRLLQSDAFPARGPEDASLEMVAAEIQSARQVQRSARGRPRQQRPASASAMPASSSSSSSSSSSRRHAPEAQGQAPAARSQGDAAAALAGAAAAVAAAAAMLAQGACGGSDGQGGAEALARAAAALSVATGATPRGPSTESPAQAVQVAAAESSHVSKEAETLKVAHGSGKVTEQVPAVSGNDESLVSEALDEEALDEVTSDTFSGTTAPAASKAVLQDALLEPVMEAPANDASSSSSTRGLETQLPVDSQELHRTAPRAPPSPLSAEEARRLADELISEDEDEDSAEKDQSQKAENLVADKPPSSEEVAPLSKLLGGNGHRPAVPKLLLAAPLPGPPPRPAGSESFAPTPPSCASQDASVLAQGDSSAALAPAAPAAPATPAAPVPPAPTPSTLPARSLPGGQKEASKLSPAPAPPTSIASIASKKSSFVGGA